MVAEESKTEKESSMIDQLDKEVQANFNQSITDMIKNKINLYAQLTYF